MATGVRTPDHSHETLEFLEDSPSAMLEHVCVRHGWSAGLLESRSAESIARAHALAHPDESTREVRRPQETTRLTKEFGQKVGADACGVDQVGESAEHFAERVLQEMLQGLDNRKVLEHFIAQQERDLRGAMREVAHLGHQVTDQRQVLRAAGNLGTSVRGYLTGLLTLEELRTASGTWANIEDLG